MVKELGFWWHFYSAKWFEWSRLPILNAFLLSKRDQTPIKQHYVVGFFVKQCTQDIVMSGLKFEDIHLPKVLLRMNMIYHAMGLVI